MAGVEPHVAAFTLAELAAVSLGHQRRGEGKGFAARLAPDEFGAGRDVAPLVGAAHLEPHALGLIEVVKVVPLEQLVRKFGERKAGFESLFHAVLSHHVVHRQVLAGLAQELQETDVLEPVVVVDQFGRVGTAAEVEKLFELLADAGLIAEQYVFGKELSFGRLARRVADHAGGAAHQGHGFVPDRWRCTSSMMVARLPMCSEAAVGSKPT
jgi:hypothetical protein